MFIFSWGNGLNNLLFQLIFSIGQFVLHLFRKFILIECTFAMVALHHPIGGNLEKLNPKKMKIITL